MIFDIFAQIQSNIHKFLVFLVLCLIIDNFNYIHEKIVVFVNLPTVSRIARLENYQTGFRRFH